MLIVREAALVTSGTCPGARRQLEESMARAGSGWSLWQRMPGCQPAPKVLSSGEKKGLDTGAVVLGGVGFVEAVGDGDPWLGRAEGLADGVAVALCCGLTELVVEAPSLADQ